MNSTTQPLGVHLVGSIPLPSASSVFTTIPSSLPNRLRRIPDGETGPRQLFGATQFAVFQLCPFVLRSFPKTYDSSTASKQDGLPPTSGIKLLSTGYDDAALGSYREFCLARDQGHIPPGVRFQVSLPTPLTIVAVCIQPEYQIQCETLYNEQLILSLRRIQDEIPASDLAIQWDLPIEFAMLEDLSYPLFKPWFSPVSEGIVGRLAELAKAVDEDVELGFHFCYGDMDHAHFVEPKDISLMVQLARDLKKNVKRKIDWIHMPVPKDRTDEEFFLPLRDLELESTELYLGLVHEGEEEGTRPRIEVAGRCVERFGVATECGMGRTPEGELEGILRIEEAVSRPFV
jgi:hypothetical protein